MNSIEVYNLINSIKEGNSGVLDQINENSITYLQENGLISIFPTSDMDNTSISGNESKKRFSFREIGNIYNNVYSKLNQLWTGDKNIGIMTDDGYIKLTDSGKDVEKRLAAALPRLDGVSYDDFYSELDAFRVEINERYKRFKDIYQILINGADKQQNDIITRYALALSSFDGSIEDVYGRASLGDIYDRALYINKYLFLEKGVYGGERFRVASEVALADGYISELHDLLVSVYAYMNEDNPDIFSWLDAAEVMKIPGKDLDERVERYNEVLGALGVRDWSRDQDSRYIVSKIAQRDEDLGEITDRLRKIMKKLPCSKKYSGMAALILMDGNGSPDECVGRLEETIKVFSKYGFVSDNEFPAFAAVSLMPGTVEENGLWLNDVARMMKNDGFEYDLGKAAQVITGGFDEYVRDWYNSFKPKYDRPKSGKSGSCGGIEVTHNPDALKLDLLLDGTLNGRF